MRRFILGTAGHIDHGKTALVRALTGIDTDRLPEEKRRGITIDLGFARMPLGDDCELGIVDVPGHEAFVRNMLAGATGIDLALLVIAGDEGVMPQTREHLAIIEMLGVQRAVIAITKCDLVDDDWLDLVTDDVTHLLAPTPFADAPVVRVSARTGAGLENLVQTLTTVAAGVPARSSDDLFRMPIDRVFTVRGTGTVVTGTVWSGTLHDGEHVRIEPAGLTARVRGLQHHGKPTELIQPGARAAIALASLDRQLLARGDTVVTGAGWSRSSIITTRITLVRDAVAPLRPRQRVRVHIGTAEVLARVALLDRELQPGDTAIAQLRLETPVLARARDRLILRSYSPVHTIAGGVLLEPMAPKRKRLSPEQRSDLNAVLDPDQAIVAILSLSRGEVAVTQLPVLAGLSPTAVTRLVSNDTRLVLAGERVFDARRISSCRDQIVDVVFAYHGNHPLDDGIDRETLRKAVDASSAGLFDVALHKALSSGELTSRGSAIANGRFQPRPAPADQPLLEAITAVFETAGLQSPSLDELAAGISETQQLLTLLRHLEREGTLVRLAADRWMAHDALRAGAEAIRTQMPLGEPLEIADFRTVLGLSRKHLIPLLEYFDRVGITLRQGEKRIIRSDFPVVPVSSLQAVARSVSKP